MQEKVPANCGTERPVIVDQKYIYFFFTAETRLLPHCNNLYATLDETHIQTQVIKDTAHSAYDRRPKMFEIRIGITAFIGFQLFKL
jgi:hypothetical protein